MVCQASVFFDGWNRPVKKTVLSLSVISALILIFVEAFSAPPLVIWNRTHSIEPGLYVWVREPIQLGSIVAVMPSKRTRNFITERHYLPPTVPLLKQVFAIEGSEICRIEDEIFIDNEWVSKAQTHDDKGRVMPIWHGCFILQPGEYFLLNDHPKSLDGRYFMQTTSAQIIGVYQHIRDIKLF